MTLTALLVCFILLQSTVAATTTTYGKRHASSSTNTVAMIIGGYWINSNNSNNNNNSNPVLSSVELFGCGGKGNDSILLPTPFPQGVYLTSGRYLEDEGRIMVCGGYSCDNGSTTAGACKVTPQCYYLSPNDKWVEGPRLEQSRWVHFMALVNDVNDTSKSNKKRKVPLVLGNTAQTEILSNNNNNDTWREYLSLPESAWYYLGCMVQHGEKIYSLRDRVIELDPSDWTFNDLGSIPTSLANPGKCAAMDLEGRSGIFLRYGYWFDLEKRTWHVRSAPPHRGVPTADFPNAMWTFRGRPTIFGSPNCDGMGACKNTDVVQYDPDKDAWSVVGKMRVSRTYHEVVEVPAEFCPEKVSFLASSSSSSSRGNSAATSLAGFLVLFLVLFLCVEYV